MVGHRTHDFDAMPLPQTPSVDDLVDLLHRLDDDNEAQRLRLYDVFAWFEEAVTGQVRAERERDACSVELALRDERIQQLETELAAMSNELTALHQTKLFRIARPFRSSYGRLRNRRG